jgi:AraC family transcriptional regulator of adaptative response/methylated-DNA-[protein]-cysteine methyltransferase
VSPRGGFRYTQAMTPYERVEKVIRYIEEHRLEQPRLAELAKAAGLSEFHLHRLFTKWAGTTPKAFLKALTSEHAKSLLASRDVLAASVEAGLSGPGRLHDLMVTVEGMTPGELKSGGAGLTISHGVAQTPFGPALVAVTPRGVCHFEFLASRAAAGAVAALRRRFPKARLSGDRKAAQAVADKAFKKGGALPVLLAGTAFQLKVWQALLRIPRGRASSYGALAAAVGSPKASRAVGSAVGANTVAFLIPCHRVIRETGALGGYRWGPRRKQAMLAWESARP